MSPPVAGWRIWMRWSPSEEWLEPAIAGTDVGWESKEDAEMFAESFRQSVSPDVEVCVLPEDQLPEAG